MHKNCAYHPAPRLVVLGVQRRNVDRFHGKLQFAVLEYGLYDGAELYCD